MFLAPSLGRNGKRKHVQTCRLECGFFVSSQFCVFKDTKWPFPVCQNKYMSPFLSTHTHTHPEMTGRRDYIHHIFTYTHNVKTTKTQAEHNVTQCYNIFKHFLLNIIDTREHYMYNTLHSQLVHWLVSALSQSLCLALYLKLPRKILTEQQTEKNQKQKTWNAQAMIQTSIQLYTELTCRHVHIYNYSNHTYIYTKYTQII